LAAAFGHFGLEIRNELVDRTVGVLARRGPRRIEGAAANKRHLSVESNWRRQMPPESPKSKVWPLVRRNA
jgi:hypothetical protein